MHNENPVSHSHKSFQPLSVCGSVLQPTQVHGRPRFMVCDVEKEQRTFILEYAAIGD